MSSEKEKQQPGGRAKKAILREKWIGVRFTVEEYNAMKKKAKEAGWSMSHYLREAVINATVVSRLTAVETDYIRQLVGMSTNLNQVAHKGHTEGYASALQYFQYYQQKIDAIIQKLYL